jgi:hypothetical protein
MVDPDSGIRSNGKMNDQIRPASPGSNTIKTNGTNPADLDPDLAAMEMIKEMLKGMDSPSDITKPFAGRKAIYTAMNHVEPTFDDKGNMTDPGNLTGYDASGRVGKYGAYTCYERSSLNILAKLFNSFMAFLMKPKMIIQGLPQNPAGTQERGFFGRMIDRVTGNGQPSPQPAQVQQ